MPGITIIQKITNSTSKNSITTPLINNVLIIYHVNAFHGIYRALL